MRDIIQFVVLLLQVLSFAVIARSLMSWFPMNPSNPVATVLVGVTEPILAPLRRIVPRFGMLDLTPMVAIILLQVISWVLQGAAA